MCFGKRKSIFFKYYYFFPPNIYITWSSFFIEWLYRFPAYEYNVNFYTPRHLKSNSFRFQFAVVISISGGGGRSKNKEKVWLLSLISRILNEKLPMTSSITQKIRHQSFLMVTLYSKWWLRVARPTVINHKKYCATVQRLPC